MLGAVRLLEDQGIARMRRGPGGGLTVLGGSPSTITRFLAAYFLACGITPRQRKESESAISLLVQAVREGRIHGRVVDGVCFRLSLPVRGPRYYFISDFRRVWD